MPPMPETSSAAADQPAPDDLISFLKAIPDCNRIGQLVSLFRKQDDALV